MVVRTSTTQVCIWNYRNDKIWQQHGTTTAAIHFLSPSICTNGMLSKLPELKLWWMLNFFRIISGLLLPVLQNAMSVPLFSPAALLFLLAMSIQDSNGQLLSAKSSVIHGLVRPWKAESLALYQAISRATDLGYQNVNFETDCKSIVDHLLSNKPGSSDLNVILRNCRTKLSSSPKSIVSFCWRQANLVANKLARKARRYASNKVFNYFPACISHLLRNDII